MSRFNVDVCGSEGCGKSAFLRRHKTGDFYREPVPLKTAVLEFRTNEGDFVLACTEGVTDTADARIVMFDSSKPYEEEIRRVAPLLETDKPKVLCGNKVDVVDFDEIGTRSHGVSYYISAKSNYDFEKPFRYLLRILTNSPKLEFVARSAPV